jgi:predicted RNA binding protein YcfA (HicA-like mRNA interferase family)
MSNTFTGKDLLKLLKRKGCVAVRQVGSHVRVECGTCATTVAVHAGETIPIGTLKHIERDLTPCLGKGWLRS